MSLAILFLLLCAQFVSDINMSIFRLRFAGFSLQNEHHQIPAAPKLQHTTKWEQDDRCGNATTQSRLLKMDILMSETYWAHKKWNKIASDKLVFHSSSIKMMHGPINIRCTYEVLYGFLCICVVYCKRFMRNLTICFWAVRKVRMKVGRYRSQWEHSIDGTLDP